ncbi:hypothetical protein ACO34A_04670 [Rhizobium sp. ACO-34A]|nr:hypothetical protein [Rhizobium sp. ACO-34A]ATN33095.1 hypothetical protein ACO34A_04670 [Rhizobium sp. ACO-34A]
MELTQQDIKDIAELLPSADEGNRQISQITRNADLNWPRNRLFATAANLQLLTEGIVPGIEQTGAPAIGPSALPARMFSVSYGFISLKEGLAKEIEWPISRSGNFTFGISILATAPAGKVHQELLETSVHFARREFPVVVTYTGFKPHGIPPHPDHPSTVGSSACWVKPAMKNPPFDHGILTARHVIEHLSLGRAIDLDPSTDHSTPNRGYLADSGHCAVDAAVIEIDAADWPTGLSRLSLLGPFPNPSRVVSPSDAVTLDGRVTAAGRRSVLSHHPLPGYWGSMMGQRLVLDAQAQGGDSGALATHNHTGAGVGIYMGEIDDGKGGKNGLCQDLYQAVKYLEVDPYL